jgi:hypothetical protein
MTSLTPLTISARHGQYDADDQRGQRLELAVAVVVPLVARLAGDSDEHQHDDVGDEVAQRMHRVGHHRRTPAHDSGHELQHYQQGVDRRSDQRHPVYLLLSLVHIIYLTHVVPPHYPGAPNFSAPIISYERDFFVNLQKMLQNRLTS